MTMNYSYHGAKKLNDLGLPVYFIIGNHDLYHRHTRELYSSINFHEFSNFKVINEPTVIEEVGDGVLMCPYLFHHEYADLAQHLKLKTWWGHFEFKGFQVTGSGMLMPTGPEADDFKGPLHIFSGHFHKRQLSKNVVYIGNTFPTNYSDADDDARGMMIYDHSKDIITFVDWEECPKFTKITLTNLIDNAVKIPKGSRVKCIMDCPITFEESSTLRQQFITDYELREFMMEESDKMDEALSETETDVDTEDTNDDGTVTSIDDLVIKMLSEIQSDLIDNQILINQYQRLKI